MWAPVATPEHHQVAEQLPEPEVQVSPVGQGTQVEGLKFDGPTARRLIAERDSQEWPRMLRRSPGESDRDLLIRRLVNNLKSANDGECWECRKVYGFGYGVVRFNGQNISAHRAGYIAAHGSIPSNLLACHQCDNPRCCNPDHILMGTASDNAQDALDRNRIKGKPNGLTGQEKNRIRELLAEGYSGSSLARWYGVTPNFVCRLKGPSKDGSVYSRPGRPYPSQPHFVSGGVFSQ